MNTLYIVDVSELAYRCYFRDKEKMAEGCKTFLMDLFENRNPTHIVGAGDPVGYLRRHSIYPNYKSGRKEKEPEFVAQYPDFLKVFEDFGIKIIKINEWEADDVIGSIAKQWGGVNTQVFIMSNDKDMMQLVDDNVRIYKQLKFPDFEIVDKNGVYQKLGVWPHQVVDYMALTGDKADCVPGVFGIGPKAAERLIKSHSTVENVYKHAGNDKLADKLAKGVRDAEISKVLVTINTGLDLGVNIDDCRAISHSEALNRRKQ